MHIISTLADWVQRFRTCENAAIPAWQRHLNAMSQRQLADLVIPPEKRETGAGQYTDARQDQLAKRSADAP